MIFCWGCFSVIIGRTDLLCWPLTSIAYRYHTRESLLNPILQSFMYNMILAGIFSFAAYIWDTVKHEQHYQKLLIYQKY